MKGARVKKNKPTFTSKESGTRKRTRGARKRQLEIAFLNVHRCIHGTGTRKKQGPTGTDSKSDTQRKSKRNRKELGKKTFNLIKKDGWENTNLS